LLTFVVLERQRHFLDARVRICHSSPILHAYERVVCIFISSSPTFRSFKFLSSSSSEALAISARSRIGHLIGSSIGAPMLIASVTDNATAALASSALITGDEDDAMPCINHTSALFLCEALQVRSC